MALATKSMGLNPDVLSFAYADMSSVSSSRRTRKNICLGTERLVQFYSSDPEDLGIEIEHSDDGYVRIVSTSGDGMYEGTVHAGDIVCEIAGVNMRRPITEHMWKLTTGLMKVAPRPIEVIVAAEEHESKESGEEELGAIGNGLEKNAGNIDAEKTQTPSLVKQAMSAWQNLNLNGGSKEEYHDSPGNGTSDTASMSDGNEGSTVQAPDPYNDPERFGVERRIIFHAESLGIKLHRCQNEGIVQILHVDHSVSEEDRKGEDNGRLDVGDVIVEVGGVDLRHKFIGPLEWADMVYFVQNVGRPLDMVVVEDYHCARERDEDSGVTYNVEQELEEHAKDEGEVENTDEKEVEKDAKDKGEAKNLNVLEASDHLIPIEGERDPEVDEEVDAGLDEEVDQESAIDFVAVEEDIEEVVEEAVEEVVEEAVEEAVEESIEEAVEEEVDQESAIGLVNIEEAHEEVVEEVVKEAEHKVVLELDETLEKGTNEEDSSIDDEYYEEDDESEHKQEDSYGNEISDDELSDMMMSQVEQFVASKEKDVTFSVSVEEEEPVQQVEIKRTRQQIEGELSQLPKFSPAWFSLKSELIELLASEGDLEQKRPTSSFYFRTHPNNKSSHVAVSSVSEVSLPSQSKGSDSSVVSMETVEASESSTEPPLTPTSIIEEEDAFEVTMWAGPKDNKPKEDNEAAFLSTFGGGLFSMADSDTEEPFTGGINFDAPPPRIPVSNLFSHAFVVNRAGDVGSPLFVVKKTLPNQNKTDESSGYLQMEAPRRQAQEAKIHNTKPALDMSKISLESAQSEESAWDTADFAREVDAQADSFFLDSLCGDTMCEGLINDGSAKKKEEKSRRKRLFGKLRKNKRKDEAKMSGYGSLDDDTEDYRTATAALALQKFKSKKTAEFTGFHPINDEVDL